tara:strand:- start:4535 stop:4702 length:168 start_codon:yes stop_codon:yes gene_type:complete
MKIEDYNKLKPLTYTILTKKTKIETIMNGKIETIYNLDRGIMFYVVKKAKSMDIS